MKIQQCFLELQLKMSGMFFETHCSSIGIEMLSVDCGGDAVTNVRADSIEFRHISCQKSSVTSCRCVLYRCASSQSSHILWSVCCQPLASLKCYHIYSQRERLMFYLGLFATLYIVSCIVTFYLLFMHWFYTVLTAVCLFFNKELIDWFVYQQHYSQVFLKMFGEVLYILLLYIFVFFSFDLIFFSSISFVFK